MNLYEVPVQRPSLLRLWHVKIIRQKWRQRSNYQEILLAQVREENTQSPNLPQSKGIREEYMCDSLPHVTRSFLISSNLTFLPSF